MEKPRRLWGALIAACLIASAAFLATRPKGPPPGPKTGAVAPPSVMAQITYQRTVVRPAIPSKAAELQKCYLEYLASKPRVSDGAIELAWGIGQDGSVREVRTVRADFKGTALVPCVSRIVGTWRFDPAPPGGGAQVSHVFNFKKAPGT